MNVAVKHGAPTLAQSRRSRLCFLLGTRLKSMPQLVAVVLSLAWPRVVMEGLCCEAFDMLVYLFNLLSRELRVSLFGFFRQYSG
eukprot:9062076-Pyramimonas_sp.AAC.1